MSGCCMYIGKEHSIAKRLQSYSFWSGLGEPWTVIPFLESVLLLVKCPTYHLLGGEGYEAMHIKNFFFSISLKTYCVFTSLENQATKERLMFYELGNIS